MPLDGSFTYNRESANKYIGRLALSLDNLIDKVGSEADDGNERKKLKRAQGSEGHAQSAELGSLETHSERDGFLEIGDEREAGTRLVPLEGGTQGKMRPRERDSGGGQQW